MIMGIFFMACESTNDRDPIPEDGSAAVFILCEGNYGHHNGSLSALDSVQTDTSYINVFDRGRNGPGDYPHDGIILDSTMYLAVTGSDRVQIVHRRTYRSLGAITGIRSPRSLIEYQGRLFITSYFDSSVVVVDRATRQIQNTIKLNHRPDEIKRSGSFGFVSNARNALVSTMENDSTISRIDLNSLSVQAFVVGQRPYSVAVDSVRGYIYVANTGRSTNSGNVVTLNATTGAIIDTIDSGLSPSRIVCNDSTVAYIIHENGPIRLVNLTSQIRTDLPGNYYSLALTRTELFAGDPTDFIGRGELVWFRDHYQTNRRYPVGVSPSAFLWDQN